MIAVYTWARSVKGSAPQGRRRKCNLDLSQVIDMSEGKRRNAEAEVRLLKAAFDSILEYVAVTDGDGRILECNKPFAAFFGRGTLKDAIAPMLDGPEKARAAFLKWAASAPEAKAGDASELRIKGGHLFEFRFKPLKSAKGRRLVCWLIQDISEMDKVQRKLGALNSELERRIERRTADLEAESARSRRLESIVREVDERERGRLGRDIHDMVGQTLTALAIRTEVLKNRLVIEGSAHALDAASILDNIKLLMDQTRALSRQLFPVAVESRGIDEALIELANSIHVSLGVDCSCRFSGQKLFHLLDAEAKINIFRICQEAVANAIKHGKAKRMTISLTLKDASGTLVIGNNGLPFPRHAESGDGIGMSIMKSRAEILGGSLSISKPGAGGVKVKCAFPLNGGKVKGQ